jgi:hypothetical protein
MAMAAASRQAESKPAAGRPTAVVVPVTPEASRASSMLATVWLLPRLLLAAPAPGAATSRKNFLLIAIDDLRPEFGDSFDNKEVLTPHMDKHFTNGGGSAMQHSYVQIAVCGPSRASILTGRRPDTTTCGTNGNGPRGPKAGWCWCQRTKCDTNDLFMTLPTWFAQHGYVTAGNGKIFHPDACTLLHKPDYGPHFSHRNGDDGRAWNYDRYGVEGHLRQPFSNFTTAFSQEQWGTIPGPDMAVFSNTRGGSRDGQGLDWMRSPLSDEEQTDGQIATHTIERLANFSRDGIGSKDGSSKPFFLATGFHKPVSHFLPSGCQVWQTAPPILSDSASFCFKRNSDLSR